MELNGLIFECTCSACPEQYDVYDQNHQKVGYVRLRWGCVTCEVPDVFGELIYSASIGDGWAGMFEDDEQRFNHLKTISDEIKIWIATHRKNNSRRSNDKGTTVY